MSLLSYFELTLIEFTLFVLIVLIASTVRGFSGFGFAAISVSGLSFILPPIEIVPVILILEVLVSIFMIPYIWNKIDWKLVVLVLIGIIIGSPLGVYFLKIFSANLTHLLISIIIIFFSSILIKGYLNKRLNTSPMKIFTGTVGGVINGLTTLGGLPCAIFLLATGFEASIIRGSLAALFFFTDIYALFLSFFAEIIDMKSIYRVLPLIIILPIGIKIGDIFFNKSREQTYRKFVLYFLIFISFFGIIKVLTNIY